MISAPLQVCGHCGAEFKRTYRRRRYCSDECSIEGPKALHRRSAIDHYWRDPEAGRRAATERYAANPDYFRNYRAEHSNITCSVCGSLRRRGDIPLALRSAYVCRDCQKASHRIKTQCYFCERDLVRPSYRLGHSKAYCPDCLGILSRVGEEFGVTRERIRQLIRQIVSRAAVQGVHLSQKQALDLVCEARRAQNRLSNFVEVPA